MKKTPILLLLLLASTLACTAVTGLLGVATPTLERPEGYHDMTAVCKDAVDGIKGMHHALDFPDFDQYEDLEKDISGWVERMDVAEYLDVLDHLSLEDGYYLSHMYYYDWMGGGPILYVAEEGEGPWYRIEDFTDSLMEELGHEPDWDEVSAAHNLIPHIRMDGTPEAYFQFMMLSLLGEQFDLWWHSNYNDTVILCDQKDMDAVQNTLDEFDIDLSNSMKADIEALDLTPTVIVSDDTVEIRFITFTKWGGFYEEVYILDRGTEVEVLESDSKNLIEYDCGIMF